MQINIYNDSSESINISDAVFVKKFNPDIVHQVVVAYQARGRQGSVAQKTRAEVRGGGKKPWRQKGSGRARAGSSRGPLWRGGGVTFASKPRSYHQKVNKKVYRKGIAVILSNLLREERLLVIDQLKLDEPKTKLLLILLNSLKIDGSVYILLPECNDNVNLASRNLHYVNVDLTSSINILHLLRHDKTVITVDALRKIEEWLS